MDLAPLAHTFGYPLVFLGAAAEGEWVLMAAGFLVHRGYLEWWWVWPLAALGGTGADQVFFYLGRKYGDRLINRLPRVSKTVLDRARALVLRRLRFVLLTMRFLMGMRVLLPVLCGTFRVGPARFTAYNAATAVVWSGLFLSLGYLYGEAARHLFRKVEDIEALLVVALAVGAVGSHLIRRNRVPRESDTLG